MRSLETTPALFHGVAGALRVISHGEAANLLDQIRKFIQQTILTRNITPDQPLLDALADSIAGIEYYMEAVADSRVEPRLKVAKPLSMIQKRSGAGLSKPYNAFWYMEHLRNRRFFLSQFRRILYLYHPVDWNRTKLKTSQVWSL